MNYTTAIIAAPIAGTVKLDQVIFNGKMMWEVKPGTKFMLIGGIRTMSISPSAHFTGQVGGQLADISVSKTEVAGVGGCVYRPNLGREVMLLTEADIGGGSSFTFSALGGLEFQIKPWIGLAAGYSVLRIDTGNLPKSGNAVVNDVHIRRLMTLTPSFRRPVRAIALAGLVALSAPGVSYGQAGAGTPPTQGESTELAKKLSNPISDLVSVPFQFNWEQPAGPDKDTRFILNVQPVMPFSLNKRLNMITRIIMPLVSQPALVAGGTPTFGVSDIQFSNFFSPVTSGHVVWGVGPILSLPSTSEPTLGSGKWSAGPTFVVLDQSGHLTYGLLFNQLWSFAGNTTRADVNQTFLQPFFAYTTKGAVTVTISSESSANWKATDQQWNVPIIFALSKLSSFGVFPASYQVGVGAFVVHPDESPSWKLRGAIVILLPRRK